MINRIFLIVDKYEINLHRVKEELPTLFSFREADQNDINNMQKEYPGELTQRKIEILKRRVVAPKQRVYICTTVDKKIAGYFCVSEEDTYESGLKCSISVKESEIYFFDDYVFKKHRNQSIQAYAIDYRVNVYKEKKQNGTVCIYANNKASIRNYLSRGANYQKSYFAIRPMRVVFSFNRKIHIKTM